MQYLYLLYSQEPQESQEPPTAEEMQAWFDYTQWLKDEGVYLGGEALEGVATATTIRTEGSDFVLTDGPFAETKEQLGGFYLVECQDLDQALHYAKPCPATKYGSVEVRPIMVIEPS